MSCIPTIGRASRRRSAGMIASSCWHLMAGWRSNRCCPPRSGAVWCSSILRSRKRASLRAWRKGCARPCAGSRPGVYLAWYPIKDHKSVAGFHADLAAIGGPELLRVELMIRNANTAERLNGCGLIVANPPYTLSDQLALVLPALVDRLARGAGCELPARSHHCRRPRNAWPNSGPAGAKGARRREVQALICLALLLAIIDTCAQFGQRIGPGLDCRDCPEMTCADASTLSRAPHLPRLHRTKLPWLHARWHAC